VDFVWQLLLVGVVVVVVVVVTTAVADIASRSARVKSVH